MAPEGPQGEVIACRWLIPAAPDLPAPSGLLYLSLEVVMKESCPEAHLERDAGGGLVPSGEGWFIVNLAEASAKRSDRFGDGCRFEGAARFPEFGIHVRVLPPRTPACLYHREGAQEAFLVLKGECLAIVEEQERRLRTGDFLFTPPGTNHVLVGAGEAPCVILMVGARKADQEVHYPVSPAAARYGASVAQATSSVAEAYAQGSPWSAEATTLGDVL